MGKTKTRNDTAAGVFIHALLSALIALALCCALTAVASFAFSSGLGVSAVPAVGWVITAVAAAVCGRIMQKRCGLPPIKSGALSGAFFFLLLVAAGLFWKNGVDAVILIIKFAVCICCAVLGALSATGRKKKRSSFSHRKL